MAQTRARTHRRLALALTLTHTKTGVWSGNHRLKSRTQLRDHAFYRPSYEKRPAPSSQRFTPLSPLASPPPPAPPSIRSAASTPTLAAGSLPVLLPRSCRSRSSLRSHRPSHPTPRPLARLPRRPTLPFSPPALCPLAPASFSPPPLRSARPRTPLGLAHLLSPLLLCSAPLPAPPCPVPRPQAHARPSRSPAGGPATTPASPGPAPT